MAGVVIKGRIIVTQTNDFMASELSVAIHGSEQTYFELSQTTDNANLFLGKRSFIQARFTVNKYPNNVSPLGTQEFDFEFRTPEWLPDSTIYTAEHARSILNIRYCIFAQMVPVSSKDYMDKDKEISIFRATKDIYILQRTVSIHRQIDLKTVLISKIGGVFGFGGSECSTQVIFNQQ